jgi:hypothetical protein
MVRRSATYSNKDMTGRDAAYSGKGIPDAVSRTAMRTSAMRWLDVMLLPYLGSFSVRSSVGYFSGNSS